MKKILISLDELENLYESATCCGFSEEKVREWFDVQPDIRDIIADGVKEGLKNAKDSFINAALSKMETTGDKDDN